MKLNMNPTHDIEETTMKNQTTRRTAKPEAPGSSVRPINLTRRHQTEARKAARQIGRTAHARKGIAEDLARVLAAFGGHITRIELPAQ